MTGSEPVAASHKPGDIEADQLVSQFQRCSDDKRLHPVDGLDSGLDSRALDDLEHHHLVETRLWVVPGYSGEDRPCCHLSIYSVALTQSAASRPVWPVDLDDSLAKSDQVPCQFGPVRARIFDTEGNDLAQPGRPAVETLVIPRCNGQPTLTSRTPSQSTATATCSSLRVPTSTMTLVAPKRLVSVTAPSLCSAELAPAGREREQDCERVSMAKLLSGHCSSDGGLGGPPREQVDRSQERHCPVPLWVRPEPRRPRWDYHSPIIADNPHLSGS